VRLHGFCTRRYLDEVVLTELRAGWAKGGRPREAFEIGGRRLHRHRPDGRDGRQDVRVGAYAVAFYGSTPAYWPVLEVHGFHDLGRKLNVMSKTGQWTR